MLTFTAEYKWQQNLSITELIIESTPTNFPFLPFAPKTRTLPSPSQEQISPLLEIHRKRFLKTAKGQSRTPQLPLGGWYRNLKNHYLQVETSAQQLSIRLLNIFAQTHPSTEARPLLDMLHFLYYPGLDY